MPRGSHPHGRTERRLRQAHRRPAARALEIALGTVVVNGVPLVEPAVVCKALWNLRALTLGEHEYFVIGDNHGMAIQNHDF